MSLAPLFNTTKITTLLLVSSDDSVLLHHNVNSLCPRLFSYQNNSLPYFHMKLSAARFLCSASDFILVFITLFLSLSLCVICIAVEFSFRSFLSVPACYTVSNIFARILLSDLTAYLIKFVTSLPYWPLHDAPSTHHQDCDCMIYYYSIFSLIECRTTTPPGQQFNSARKKIIKPITKCWS